MGALGMGLTGMGRQTRSARGGRKRGEHTRCERIVAAVHAAEKRDLEVLCVAWDVPESTLVWGIVHDWLQRARVVGSDMGDMRVQLRAALELAVHDVELRPWLKAQLGEAE